MTDGRTALITLRIPLFLDLLCLLYSRLKVYFMFLVHLKFRCYFFDIVFCIKKKHFIKKMSSRAEETIQLSIIVRNMHSWIMNMVEVAAKISWRETKKEYKL